MAYVQLPEFIDASFNLIGCFHGYREIAGTHTGMTNPNHLVIIPGAPIKYMSADVP